MKHRYFVQLCGGMLIGVLVRTVGLAFAQTSEPDANELRQKLIDGVAALGSGAYAALDDLLAETYTVYSPLGPMNRAGVEGFFDAMRAALNDFQVERHVVIVDGNMAAVRLNISGVFENDFMGPMGVLPPTGKPVSIATTNVFKFDDNGKVVEEWAQYDVLGFLTQFGAMQPPA